MTDSELITKLGGATALARKLGTTPQAVCNWRTRGIPARIKLEYQELFEKAQKNEKSK